MINFIRKVFARPKRYYSVGDVAPDSLINNTGNLGAFISIDPETKIITAIVVP